LGGLSAFIYFSDKKISISREVSVESGNLRVVADMVLEKGKEKVILELRRARGYTTSTGSDEDQVFTYLAAARIETGILYFAPDVPVQEMMESVVEKKIGHKVWKVVKLYPKET
jgi:hypothetical protein